MVYHHIYFTQSLAFQTIIDLEGFYTENNGFFLISQEPNHAQIFDDENVNSWSKILQPNSVFAKRFVTDSTRTPIAIALVYGIDLESYDFKMTAEKPFIKFKSFHADILRNYIIDLVILDQMDPDGCPVLESLSHESETQHFLLNEDDGHSISRCPDPPSPTWRPFSVDSFKYAMRTPGEINDCRRTSWLSANVLYPSNHDGRTQFELMIERL